MSGYNIVSKSIWNSQKFKSLKDSDSRLLFLYLLNNQHANSCGCYHIHIGYIMADLDWSEDRSRKALDTLCDTLLIKYDTLSHTLYVPKFFNHNPPTNPKHAIKVFNDILSIAYQDFKIFCAQEFATILADKRWTLPDEKQELLDTLSKGYHHLTQRNVTKQYYPPVVPPRGDDHPPAETSGKAEGEIQKGSPEPEQVPATPPQAAPDPDKPKRKPRRTGERLEAFMRRRYPDEPEGCPQDWGEEAVAKAREFKPDTTADFTKLVNWHFQQFYNHFVSSTKANASKSDWRRAWLNWWMTEFEKIAKQEERDEFYRQKR